MLLFPHETVRPSQEEFVKIVQEAVVKGSHALLHAPTGLGKTAASIAPAITEALEKDLTVFFLTSRHTQHDIAIKTLRGIRDRHGKDIPSIDIIGKKWMCLQPGASRLPSGEFTEFCRNLREDGKCDYYTNLKKGENLTTQGKLTVETLSAESPVRSKKIVSVSEEHKVCPYYASIELAKKAKVIIGDYYYIFHPKIREQFLQRTNNELEKAVIIVDEAHNLPQRIKHLASSKLSSIIIKRAISEANKHKLEGVTDKLLELLSIYNNYLKTISEKDERRVSREDFLMKISRLGDYDSLVEEFINHGDRIREDSQVSYIGAVGSFLESWNGSDEGFARIFSRRKRGNDIIATLSYRCLDPSLISGPVIKQAHSVIMMSGTLTPTHMYKEVLGFDQDTLEKAFPSPFPEDNRLNLIIPRTSTKYQLRGEEMCKQTAKILTEIVETIPGNSAIFFPSYYLLGEINKFFQTATERTIFVENQEMTTQEKQEFIDKFRSYKQVGAVLLGVISGNFGEGIDLPGDELKGVVIVGLPLNRPDLETESLIAYYDEKFSKGWDYGYLFPAFNKTMQSAGRCIRSENDRGVIVFLDERYAWPNYKRCFPPDAKVTISLLYKSLIEKFFKNSSNAKL